MFLTINQARNIPDIAFIIKRNTNLKFLRFSSTNYSRGFYPQGRGEVTTVVHPVTGFQPVSMVEFGSLKIIHGAALVAGNLPVKVLKV